MTRLIVISNETDFPGEVTLINELFRSEMRLFHLRKPSWSIDDQRSFLSKIEKQFLSRISVHQHHSTIQEFDLKYYHVKESDRKKNPELIRDKNLKYSTSFHKYSDLQFESNNWDYCFLSPVFDSISKQGYKSLLADNFSITGDFHKKVFALGGVSSENIEEIFNKDFFGAAVLGSVWSDTNNAVNNFVQLNRKCNQTVHTF